jgi:hypothetical protein
VSALQPVWAAAALEPAGRDRATLRRVDDELFAAIGRGLYERLSKIMGQVDMEWEQVEAAYAAGTYARMREAVAV